MKKLIESRKGFGQLFSILALLMANPFVLLGIAIFVIVVLLLFYFALGKIIGVGLIGFGAYMMIKNWKIGLILLISGIFVLMNPFEWSSLSAVPLSAYVG